jgi:glycosyltransferase involved in cell wall biosynthesis
MSREPSPSSPDAPLYSLIVPVYRNEAAMDPLLARVRELAVGLGPRFECLFVVDGSPDASAEILRRQLPNEAFRSQLLVLSRNFGTYAGVRAGLAAARGRYFAIMAQDLQEPRELIESFFRLLERDEADVALGVRGHRRDPLPGRLAAQGFWGLYRRLVQPDVPAGGIDMFGCNERVRGVLLALREANTSLVGLLLWVGFRRCEVLYERQQSTNARSGWTLRRKLRYMLDSVFGFSDLPIVLLMLIGAVGSAAAIALGIVVFTLWALGHIEVRGYTALMLTLLASSSAILLGLGILGGYVWRAFENTKQRPPYYVMEERVFGDKAGRGRTDP